MNLTRRDVLKMTAAAFLTKGLTGSFLDRAYADAPPNDTASDLLLWYRKPASGWGDALVLGNGRLDAMVFGGTSFERIGLNEDTLWSGGPYDSAPTVEPGILAQIRELAFAGRLRDAQNLANKLQANPKMQAAYQTVGQIELTFPGHQAATDYRRELNLDTAIASVTYTVDGVHYKREVFASPVDQVVVIRLTADQPGKLTFDTTFSTPLPDSKTETIAPDTLTLIGRNGDSTTRDLKTVLVKSALTYHASARVIVQGGQTTAQGDKVSVTNADSATILVAAATSYKKYNDVTGDPAALCQGYPAPGNAAQIPSHGLLPARWQDRKTTRPAEAI
jgi:alpha-L-fucosidase 2